jgi:hypothetical protein
MWTNHGFPRGSIWLATWALPNHSIYGSSIFLFQKKRGLAGIEPMTSRQPIQNFTNPPMDFWHIITEMLLLLK